MLIRAILILRGHEFRSALGQVASLRGRVNQGYALCHGELPLLLAVTFE